MLQDTSIIRWDSGSMLIPSNELPVSRLSLLLLKEASSSTQIVGRNDNICSENHNKAFNIQVYLLYTYIDWY